MAEEPENLTLIMLRRLDDRSTRVETKIDRVIEDLHDVKVRLTSVEEGLNGVQRRIDRLDDRVERIEKRFDLVGPAE